MYWLAYALYCWGAVFMNIMGSVFGDFPYRFDWSDGSDACRPDSYREYAEFRFTQWHCAQKGD